MDYPDEPLPEAPAASMNDTFPAARTMSPELWDTLVERLKEASPMKAGFIGNTLFIGEDDGLVTVAIHPDDLDTRDALVGDSLTELIQEVANDLCGHGITLRVVTDTAVPAPVAELPPPPPVPTPAPAPKPAKKPEPAPAPEAPPSLRPTEEEFYHDPLVELALKEFHATIIK